MTRRGRDALYEDEEKQKRKLKTYIFQRRVLAVTTLMLGVAIILWIVCMSTDHWFDVQGGGGEFSENS